VSENRNSAAESELTELGVAEARAAIRNGEITSETYTSPCLDRTRSSSDRRASALSRR